jgi:pilus assembly protein CpaE
MTGNTMSTDKQTDANPPPDQTGQAGLVPRINIEIFCDSPETAEMAQLATADRRMQPAHTTVHLGGIMGAFNAFQSKPTPNLLIVESLGPKETILSELGLLAEVCQQDTKVVVIGQLNDVLLYRELVGQGISEYLVAPLQPVQFIDAIAKIYTSPTAAPVGKAIAFIGAKGGVGSSSIAHNVGWAVARQHGVETVIADLDLAFGTAGLNFNQDLPAGLASVLAQPERIDPTLVERMLVQAGEKLRLLGGPGGIDNDFEINPPAVDAILNAVRSTVPLLVLDLPAVWSPWVKYALLHSDQVVITTTPELASLRNVKSMVDLLRAGRPNDPLPKIVLNQVGVPKRPEISPADFSKVAGAPITVVIPHDAQSFGTAQGNGNTIFEVAGKSKAAEAIKNLVLQLGWQAQEKQPEKVASKSPLLKWITQVRKN